MTDDLFQKLAATHGFAPSAALRQLLELVESTTRQEIMVRQATVALNSLLSKEAVNAAKERASKDQSV